MKDATQESHSFSGFTGVVKGMLGSHGTHRAETPSDTARGEQSSPFLNLDKNNFNDNYEDQLNLETSMQNNTRPHYRPNIDIISLDGSKNTKESPMLPSEQLGICKNMESVDSTQGYASPDLLRLQHNLHIVEEEGREGNAAAKNETPINVIARVRPLIPSEIRHPVCIEVVDESVLNGNKTQIVVRQGLVGPTMKNQDQKIYSFEKVLDTDTPQQKVFADVDGTSLCNAFINGQNCTIFVYGPTSTGKTFTMQGNAEDIIHSNNNQNHRSQIVSNNASLDQSRISINADDSILTNDFEIKNFSPFKGKKILSTNKKLGVPNSNRQQSSSFHIGKGSISGIKDEESPAKKNNIRKVARDMLAEAKDKGIIQRVLDNIFLKFSERSELAKNCEIKISFLEIYKEQVTDLLDGHDQKRIRIKHNRNHSSSMGFDVGKIVEDDQHSQVSSNKRMKAKTFYGDQDLEEIVKQKRNNLELEQQSPPFGYDNARRKEERSSFRYSSFKETKKQYQVKENAVKGVYVTNLSEVVCETAEMAYHCLLDGLMRKRMSQTARNTSSSRSHTIFQIKMYMKAQDTNTLLLPQYQQHTAESETKLVSKFCLIDLAGSERIIEAEKNAERIDEARFINKSLSALGNVVAALRTQAKQKSQANKLDQSMGTSLETRRNSFHGQSGRSSRRVSGYEQRAPPMQHIPFRDSKLTHILKDCLGSNSFTHLIICLSPSYLCLAESISTLAFTKNAKAVKQNIVENVRFKSDLVQRNLAAQKAMRGGAQSMRNRPNQANSLLSQMAGGNDEDTAMLKEIMAEFGGDHLNGMGIKQLFQLTLEQLKKFKEDQNDLQKTIVEMKKAMEKDLNNNPRAIQIITNAHSDSSYKNNSFYSSGNKTASGITPVQNSGDSGLFGIKQQQLQAQNYASAQTTTNQNTIRNGSLKSITEENYSASITSPQGGNGSSLTTHHPPKRMPSQNGEVAHLDLVQHKRKQVSTTSIMTFAGYSNNNNNNQDVFLRNMESQNNIFGQNKKSGNFSRQMLDQHNNSCETQGGLQQVLREGDDSSAYIDTEPGEINDERTPCICIAGSSNIPQTAVIPIQNLLRLQSKQDFNTMYSIVTKHLKYLIRKRILIESIKSPGRKINATHGLPVHHKRQRSWDNTHFKKHQDRIKESKTTGNKFPPTRSSRILQQDDTTKKAIDLADNSPQQEMPQDIINMDKELRSLLQSSGGSAYQEIGDFQRHVEPHDHVQGHFTKMDKAGMKYFMPTMIKSMSCPNYQSEKSNNDKTNKQDSSREDDQASSSYKNQDEIRQQYESQELEISDIYSDSSVENMGRSNQEQDCSRQEISERQVSEKGEQFDQPFESSPDKKTDSAQGIEDCPPFVYPGNNSADSLRDKSIKQAQGEQSAGRLAGNLKFEQSQGTHQNNLFENSRISGTNSYNSQQHQMVQSQSQKVFNTKIGQGNFGKSKGGSQVRVIQLREGSINNSARQLLHKSPRKLNANLKVPSTMSMKQQKQSQPKSSNAKGKDFGKSSVISNEILVVEEVNDYELGTEAFQRIRQTNHQIMGSVNSNISKDRGMGPLLEDEKLQQHSGSLVDPQQSKQSTISSIQHVQNSNKSFISNTKTFLSKKSPAIKTPSMKVSGLTTHQRTKQKSKERSTPKTFITDLNKALPKASQTGGPKNNEKLLGMLLKPKKLVANRTPIIDSKKSNYKIPFQISNTTRKQTNSFMSNSSAKPMVKSGVPMTQQVTSKGNLGVQVLDFKTEQKQSMLLNQSPLVRQATYSNHIQMKNPGANLAASPNPSFKIKQLGMSSQNLMQMKPKKQGGFAHKISKPLAGLNPDSQQ